MIIGADSESALCIAPEYDEENKYIAMMEQCGLLDRFEMVFITEKTMTTEIIPLIIQEQNRLKACGNKKIFAGSMLFRKFMRFILANFFDYRFGKCYSLEVL